MQVFTPSQVRQLSITATAAYDALVIVEDAVRHTLDRVLCALTSDKAMRLYDRAIFYTRCAWEVCKVSAILAGGLAFYAGVLSRDVWEWLMGQCNTLVEDCLEQRIEPTLALAPIPAPVALLSPPVEVVEDPRVLVTPAPIDVWDTPAETVCVLASEVVVEFPATPLPTPAPEVVDVQPKQRGRKAAATTAKKTTTAKKGGRAKAKTENVGA